MGFFSKILKKDQDYFADERLFGRYTDAYKNPDQYSRWDKAQELFESGEYQSACLNFFEYLKDDLLDNVIFEAEGEGLVFEFFQGSKKITGRLNDKGIRAESKIAEVKENKLGFMRRLLENNFDLQYGRYALSKDGALSIVFDSYLEDLNAYKLYYALREIATRSDQQDDLLLEEFDTLSEINSGHTKEIDPSERKTKFDFISSKIQEIEEIMNSKKLNLIHFQSAISYLILSFTYKVDFLVRPEGFIMKKLEEIQSAFFQDERLSTEEKNQKALKELNQIKSRTKDQVDKELYEVLSTFGLTKSVNQQTIKALIEPELKNIDWHLEQNQQRFAKAVIEYVVGYTLFNYAPPEPIRKMFLLYYQISENDFFIAQGHDHSYKKKGILNKALIQKALASIVEECRDDYPKFDIDYKQLSFEDDVQFGLRLLQMITQLDLRRKKK